MDTATLKEILLEELQDYTGEGLNRLCLSDNQRSRADIHHR